MCGVSLADIATVAESSSQLFQYFKKTELKFGLRFYLLALLFLNFVATEVLLGFGEDNMLP